MLVLKVSDGQAVMINGVLVRISLRARDESRAGKAVRLEIEADAATPIRLIKHPPEPFRGAAARFPLHALGIPLVAANATWGITGMQRELKPAAK